MDRAEALARASKPHHNSNGPPTHAERLQQQQQPPPQQPVPGGGRVQTWEEIRDELLGGTKQSGTPRYGGPGPRDRLHPGQDPAKYTDSHVSWPLGARSASNVPLPFSSSPERKPQGAVGDKGWRSWNRAIRNPANQLDEGLAASVRESIRQSEAAEVHYRDQVRALAESAESRR